MRLIIFFDLPQQSKVDKNNYLKFIKYLSSNGYIRMQYSVYSKLCINIHTLNSQKNKLMKEAPQKGDVRYLAISESQYLGIKSVHNKYSLQEKITNRDRLLIIGGKGDL